MIHADEHPFFFYTRHQPPCAVRATDSSRRRASVTSVQIEHAVLLVVLLGRHISRRVGVVVDPPDLFLSAFYSILIFFSLLPCAGLLTLFFFSAQPCAMMSTTRTCLGHARESMYAMAASESMRLLRRLHACFQWRYGVSKYAKGKYYHTTATNSTNLKVVLTSISTALETAYWLLYGNPST